MYTDAKVVLQLKGFYDEVASPLLSDVQLSYNDDQAFDVTRSLFPNYFKGSELVVAGRVHPEANDLSVTLNAFDTKKQLTIENTIPISEAGGLGDPKPSEISQRDQEEISDFVRRLWAYFTIKELLQAAESSNATTRALLEQNATSLSLEYNFVTPVTSLVVVKPEEKAEDREEKPKPDSTTKDKGKLKSSTLSKSLWDLIRGEVSIILNNPSLEHILGDLLRLPIYIAYILCKYTLFVNFVNSI